MTDEVETNRTQNVADLLEMRSRGYRELAEYRANAAEVLGGILERAGSFRHADAAEIQSAAADLVDAVYRYPDALLCLSDLHNFDPSTHQHCVNTAALSVLIARRLGLPRQEVLEIAIGALLHDLGKLTVPLSILRFPGKLSAAAWDVMKQHALQGAEIGAAYDNLSPA
ncbi:MAG: HD domain-containing protein [Candidatus Schekmanbacteria bacterium]|nr:HD domain-containing protein [Candidatus Schekmanbacteria bacterium]